MFDKVHEFVQSETVPESHNKTILKTAMKNPLLKPQLAAVQSVICECEPFLRRFQSNKPLAPFLYTAIVELIKNLIAKIVKPNILGEATSQNIIELDLKSADNLLPTENVHIGYEAKRLLKDA